MTEGPAARRRSTSARAASLASWRASSANLASRLCARVASSLEKRAIASSGRLRDRSTSPSAYAPTSHMKVGNRRYVFGIALWGKHLEEGSSLLDLAAGCMLQHAPWKAPQAPSALTSPQNGMDGAPRSPHLAIVCASFTSQTTASCDWRWHDGDRPRPNGHDPRHMEDLLETK